MFSQTANCESGLLLGTRGRNDDEMGGERTGGEKLLDKTLADAETDSTSSG